MYSAKEWTIAAACFVVLLFTAEAYSQSSSEANAVNVQSQGSVGSQTASTSAVADQGQQQGQSQTSISQGGAGGRSSVGINNSFNGAAPIRYLPVPTAVPMESYQPAIFGRADYSDKGPMFTSARAWIKLMNMVDLSVDVEGRRKIDVVTQLMTKVKTPKKDKSAKPPKPKPVKFEINDGEAINGGLVPIAMMNVRTETPNKSNSVSLAIALGKEAQKMGCNTVVFMTEGSSKVLSSWGVGIGLSYNSATVDSKPSGSGSVGSGGTGWSMGKAGYHDNIYLSAVCGVRK